MNAPSRSRRLAAFFVDALLYTVLLGLRYPGFPDALRVISALGLIALVGYQAWLLTSTGQTIGKRALKLKIVRVDDEQNGGFWRNVALRSAVARWLLGMIPFYLLVDGLFIFRADKRCLHDLMAGTRVVEAEALG